MQDIEPDEIESFTLLKDAAATAVYGEEGANGVILITSKRGNSQKPKISLRAESTLLTPTRLPKFMNSVETLDLYNEALNNEGTASIRTAEEIAMYGPGADRDLYPDTDWLKEMLREHTYNMRYTLNVRGGSERARYFVSGAFYQENGIFKEGKKNEYCMVGYRVGNTLSESGSVARGVCETNAEKHLTSVVERTQIERRDGKVMFKEGDIWTAIDDNAPVSMNMWGFTPDYFKYSEEYFVKFLKENADNIKAEYFIPLLVNDLIQTGKASVTVLDTPSKWFGVTYAADRQSVVDKIHALIAAGEYPEKLF